MRRWWLSVLLLATTAGAEEFALRAPPGFKDRSGVQELVFGQSLNGYVFGYLLGLTVANPRTDQEYQDVGPRIAGGSLLGLGAGLGGSLLATRGREVKTGDVEVINFASLEWGVTQGLLVPAIFGADEVRAYGASAMAFDAAGATAGILIARATDLSPGEASAVSLGYWVGGGMGLLTSLAAVDGGDDVSDSELRVVAAATLVAGDAGLALAVASRRTLDMDRRRVQWLGFGAVVGAGAGLGMGLVIAPHEPQPALALAAAMIPLGAVVAWLVTDDLDPYKRRVAPIDRAVVTVRDGNVRWAIPTPRVELRPVAADPRAVAVQGSVGLLEGTW
jgi:hypothetical protein